MDFPKTLYIKNNTFKTCIQTSYKEWPTIKRTPFWFCHLVSKYWIQMFLSSPNGSMLSSSLNQYPTYREQTMSEWHRRHHRRWGEVLIWDRLFPFLTQRLRATYYRERESNGNKAVYIDGNPCSESHIVADRIKVTLILMRSSLARMSK